MRLQQKTALQKVALLVRAGMMEPPKWYAAAKQVPPFHRRPSNGVEQLKLPWDALANEFTSRNPDMVEDPEWLGPKGFMPGAAPISHVFAKRQYALMQNGLRKEEAYKRTHSAMQKERAADVAAVRRMVKEASTLAGSRPSFVSDDDVYSGLRFWQTMMLETPYSDWDLAAVQGLDVFLRREVIGWDDDQLKFAQSARDGTAAALQAEINRLRVNLFPETKTAQYAYPSDVVRPVNDVEKEEEEEQEDGGGDSHGVSAEGEGEEEEEGGVVVEAKAGGEGSGEWKSALLNCAWKDTLRRFEEMTEEASHEMDWSREDRRHLDNFIVARCVRRFVLEEAFGWTPDPVADALAKMNAKMGMETLPDGTADASAASTAAAAGDGGDGDSAGAGADSSPDAAAVAAAADGGDDGVAAAASDEGSAPAAALAADGADGADGAEGLATVSESEGWLTGRSLQEFKGDWMALARKRTGRPAVAGVGRRQPRRRRDEMARPAPALEANLRAVITQAKRQLLPDLVLEVDEKAGGMGAEERKAKDAAKKKIVMADLEWEREELDVERNVMIEKLKEGLGPGELDPISAVRKKRLAKGTWKAERRRLLALEKQLYNEQRTGLFYEDEQPPREVPDLSDEVIEGEVVKRKANEFYAKEKARMKRNAKLQADAVAAGEEARRSGGGAAAKKEWEPLTKDA